MPAVDVSAMSFEAALARLEQIVHGLESGETSLEDSIGLYEEGVALRRHCEEKLAAAQTRIEQLQIGADGKPKGAQPFASE